MNLIRKYDENHSNQPRQQRQPTNRRFFGKSATRDRSRKVITDVITISLETSVETQTFAKTVIETPKPASSPSPFDPLATRTGSNHTGKSPIGSIKLAREYMAGRYITKGCRAKGTWLGSTWLRGRS